MPRGMPLAVLMARTNAMAPTVLCPIDFSDANRGALRYAAAIAAHFGGRILALAVEDPLITEAIDLGTGAHWDAEETRRELGRFTARVFRGGLPQGVTVDFSVAVGNPAQEILRVADADHCDLIVMSTHGLTGMRKMFFGSTTERVLRETTVAVLATPPFDPGPIRVSSDAQALVKRLLVPLDLSPASARQMRVAHGIAEALQVPLIALHVVEPVRSPLAERLHSKHVELERRTRAEGALDELLSIVPSQARPEALVVYGDPAEEIAKLTRDRQAGLIVIGLHGPLMRGPRMGSVTYRVLCLAPALVLALPPAATPAAARESTSVLLTAEG
jgi:nucleotide-binding universal stress UspA family protein